MDWTNLAADLDEAMAALAQGVQTSLVVVHNGKRGAGAGVVWKTGGLVITNFHVVEQRGRISIGRNSRHTAAASLGVTLPDGSEAPARLVSQAPALDLALLQVDGLASPPAPIGDSRQAKVGQVVFAAGHPWGQRGSISAGVISAFDEARSDQTSVPIIRSDVLLGPGNSGGPLVDASGRVLGINTMIVGGDQGVAIPSHVVEAFINEQLVSREPATPPTTSPGAHSDGDWM